MAPWWPDGHIFKMQRRVTQIKTIKGQFNRVDRTYYWTKLFSSTIGCVHVKDTIGCKPSNEPIDNESPLAKIPEDPNSVLETITWTLNTCNGGWCASVFKDIWEEQHFVNTLFSLDLQLVQRFVTTADNSPFEFEYFTPTLAPGFAFNLAVLVTWEIILRVLITAPT